MAIRKSSLNKGNKLTTKNEVTKTNNHSQGHKSGANNGANSNKNDHNRVMQLKLNKENQFLNTCKIRPTF